MKVAEFFDAAVKLAVKIKAETKGLFVKYLALFYAGTTYKNVVAEGLVGV